MECRLGYPAQSVDTIMTKTKSKAEMRAICFVWSLFAKMSGYDDCAKPACCRDFRRGRDGGG
jgi:hypothetical protein